MSDYATEHPEYMERNGINFRDDGFAFCDRCGYTQIVNDKCLRCDVTPTEADKKLAEEIKSRCYRSRSAPGPGYDGRPEHFDTDVAARILAAMREPPLYCGGCGKCLDCLRRERNAEERN